MKKRNYKNYEKILVAIGIVSLLLLLVIIYSYFIRPQISGFSVQSTSSSKINYLAETDCTVNFDGISIDLGTFYKNRAISSEECNKIFQEHESEIIDQLCDNSNTLGNFTIKKGEEILLSEELQCDDNETTITVLGKFSIEHGDDFRNSRSKNFYFVEDSKSKKKYKLKTEKDLGLTPGSLVKVRGNAKGNEIAIPSSTKQVSGNIQVVTAGAGAAVSGDRTTIVILTNFQDKNLECASSSINSMMFANESSSTMSVNKLYKETSFDVVSFSGATVGPFTIPYSASGSCDFSTWGSAAESAAKAAGVSLSGYQHIVHVYPRNSNCQYAGYASIGGNWVHILGYCSLADVFAHELGHNLMFNHASTPGVEYGDTSDIMGYAGIGWRHFNGPREEMAGWLPSSKIVSASGSATYTLSATEILPAAAPYPMLLKVPKIDTSENYYFSYRQKTGYTYEANLASQYINVANIHRASRSVSTGLYTYFLGSLADGGRFTDSVNGITVTQLNHTLESLTIQVSMANTTVCRPSAPTVTISGEQFAAPGKTLTYTVSIKNNDNAYCSASSFTLQGVVPTGWTGSSSPFSIDINPGSTGSLSFLVTSSASSFEGRYGFSVSTVDANQGNHSASVSGSYVVDTTAPTAPTLTGVIAKRKASLTWKGATDNYKVAKYGIIRNGVKIAETTSSTYTDSSSGTFTYNVITIDGAGNTSPNSNSVTLTVGGGKGK